MTSAFKPYLLFAGTALLLAGCATNGIHLDFGNSLTVSLESGEPASFGTGQHEIKFREIDVCDGGTPKKMIVLASETY